MSTARAAVFHAVGAAPVVETITFPELPPGHVRVELVATGVCHSDLSLANGTLAQRFPAVLGHEGSGRVVESTSDRLAVGDAVVLNWTPSCGTCWFCTHDEPYLCERGSVAPSAPYAQLADGTGVVAGLGTAAFATETVVAENACVRVPDDSPLELVALLGCAVLTGVGAVINAARVQPGATVLVIGLGGVGLSALQGARLAGAARIIAVDRSTAKEELARRCGATDVIVASDDLAKQVRALTDGRGVDHAIECVGSGATIRAAYSATRRGGDITVVGMGGRGDTVSFNALEVPYFARTLRGSMYGSSDPRTDIPRLLEHVRNGRIDLDALVTARIPLDDIGDAFAALSRGEGGRSLVVFGR